MKVWAGAVWLALVVLIAIMTPWSGHDLTTDHLTESAHLLGTDPVGRDVLWRLLFATRSFVGPGLLACAVAALIAVPTAAVAGYRGGTAEEALVYGAGVITSVPRFVLVLLACSVYGNSALVIAIAAGIASAPMVAEALRARIAELRHAEYVIANRAYGLPTWRIILVHLLWATCRRLVARQLVTVFGYFLVLETTLSYIEGGYGVREPMPSWGNMLTFSWNRADANPWTLLGPGLALTLTLVALHWVKGALREPAT